MPNVCQTEYITADDIHGHQPTVMIRKVEDLPASEASRSKKKKSEDVVLYFEGKQKGMRCNKTNQWSIAFLLGTRNDTNWIGKKIKLTTDLDADIENGGETLSIRIAGSPDATPALNAAYQEIWNAGPRMRGKLVSRIKSRFRIFHTLKKTASVEPPPEQQPAELEL